MNKKVEAIEKVFVFCNSNGDLVYKRKKVKPLSKQKESISFQDELRKALDKPL